MDPIVQSAIICGISTIFAPIIVLILRKLINNKNIPVLKKENRHIITGEWKGKIFHSINADGKSINYQFCVKLTAKRKNIKGQAYYLRKGGIMIHKIKGYYSSKTDNLILNYSNQKTPNIHKGVIICHILRVNDFALGEIEMILGKFLGFAYDINAFLAGKIILKKGKKPDKNEIKKYLTDKKYERYL